MFGVKQAWACLYGGTMLALLILTMVFWPKEGAMLSRFDFLFLAAIALQVLLIALKLERLEEVKVIAIFHVVGTLMELFKTHMGSWTYPGDAFFKIGGVPLFTGFMYACVGSYLARITRLMDLVDLPAPERRLALSAAQQDGRLVSLDAVELCLGDPCAPATATRPASKSAGPVRARRFRTTNRGGFSCNLPNAGNGLSIPGPS